MATYYTTSQGERLDLICYRHYGHLNRSVEQVLDANLLLSEQPVQMPANVEILLPDLPQPVLPRELGLWGV